MAVCMRHPYILAAPLRKQSPPPPSNHCHYTMPSTVQADSRDIGTGTTKGALRLIAQGNKELGTSLQVSPIVDCRNQQVHPTLIGMAGMIKGTLQEKECLVLDLRGGDLKKYQRWMSCSAPSGITQCIGYPWSVPLSGLCYEDCDCKH